MIGRGFGRMWPAIVFVNDGLVRRDRGKEYPESSGCSFGHDFGRS